MKLLIISTGKQRVIKDLTKYIQLFTFDNNKTESPFKSRYKRR